MSMMFVLASQAAAGPTLTAFLMSDTGVSISIVCLGTADTTRWHDGIGVVPVDGDTIYSTAAGDPFVPSGTWFLNDYGDIFRVNSVGIVGSFSFAYCF